MQVVTGQQMGEIDRYTIEELGMPGVVLMEQAGRRVTEVVQEELGGQGEPEVAVLAGRGNNGGDGFVVARLLAQQGVEVKTFLLGEKDEITGDARVNLEILDKLDICVQELTSQEEVQAVEAELKQADLAVDALLGTGIKGELRGLYPDLIKLINQGPTKVVAVDIPSGVEADTGQVRTDAVKAETTVTFALPKRGNVLYPGVEYTGELKVVDIGIPDQAAASQNSKVELLTEETIEKLLPERKSNSHKGDYGKLLVIAGSSGMTGAAVLTAQASLRAGAGLVTVGVPASLNSILEAKLTEAMTYPLAEEEGSLTVSAWLEIKELAADRDLLAVGPGLGQKSETCKLVKKLLKLNKPLVLDADGINALEGLEQAAARQAPTILTPHPGELARLSDRSIAEIEADRIGVAEEVAAEYQIYLVLKGARTVIATPEGNIYLNRTGNSGLATGGSGDVLTGLIAGELAQNLAPEKAVKLAVYLHGRAADLAAKDLTEYSLLPGDLVDYLPSAIKCLYN